MGRNWIKIETVTCDKPEVCVVATQLKVDPDLVLGKLVRLWAWAEVNRINGNDLNVTFEFIDKVVGKKGFASALVKAGWLREAGEKLQFPNFGRHNGSSGKGRALTAQRVSRHRERKRNEDEAETKDKRILEEEKPRKELVRAKPRNERRNTVKELIEDALEPVDAPIVEIIPPPEVGVFEVGEAHSLTNSSDGVEMKSAELESQASEVDLESFVYEEVMNQRAEDDGFDTNQVTHSANDLESSVELELAPASLDEFSPIDAESQAFDDSEEAENSSSAIESKGDDDVDGLHEFSPIDAESQAFDDSEEAENSSPAVESKGDEDVDGLQSPVQKGKKPRGGVAAARKTLVPEMPDQPLLF